MAIYFLLMGLAVAGASGGLDCGGDDPVAGEILDRAALFLHRAGHQFINRLDQRERAFLSEALGNRGKPIMSANSAVTCRRSPEGAVGFVDSETESLMPEIAA